MAMESVLTNLESRIEELVEAYRGAKSRAADLETAVSDLETEVDDLKAKLESSTDASARVTELEGQRDELATRLENVLSLIDGALKTDED